MLCGLCWRMLRGQDGRQWKGTYDLHFKHHDNAKDLRESADMACGICRIIRDEFPHKLDAAEVPDNTPLSVTAYLSTLRNHQHNNLFRLDFKLELDHVRRKRTFVLKQVGAEGLPFRTPISHNTSSDECFEQASQWIMRCKCAKEMPRWYPKRLVDLSELKSQGFLDTKRLVSTGQPHPRMLDEKKIRVVETAEWEQGRRPDHENMRFVTLSHRWGASTLGVMLKPNELERFKDGLRLGELPQTFRDAVEFASRLHLVGYIWIDSLCIMQGDGGKDDWLSQSALMDRVYGESFLNISATAAENSDQGLFVERKPELLWEDEINVYVNGIPGLESAAIGFDSEDLTSKHVSPSPLHQQPWISWGWFQGILRWALSLRQPSSVLSEQASLLKAAPASTNRVARRQSGLGNLRRCVLLDVSFWETLVNQAPVNKRGWVLQERLMSPRVLHFCKDQIAWECSEFDAAESRPSEVPNFQLQFDEIVDEWRLKGLDPLRDGLKLRQNRLQGLPDPDPDLLPEIYAFELWARIVEVYSRTAITKPEDKLIALSGVARWMASRIGTDTDPAEYVAGLWRKHLESQLLWRVETAFRHHDRSFENTSRRPGQYRAPSFSWASVDAHEGRGIAYGELTDRDILIEVVEASITPTSSANPFGMVTDGYVKLWGMLRRAKLLEKDKGRFSWQLRGRSKSLDAEEHSSVYLDCPSQDTAVAIAESDGIYCLPAAKGKRTEAEECKYVICLLLQLVPDKGIATFRRIGITKLSPWGDKLARHHILESFPGDVDLPHEGFDPETGRHRITII